MSKITAKQIADWKKEHFAIYIITGENDEVGYVSFPTWLNWKLAITALNKSENDFVESYLNNNWLGGDEAIKTNYGYFKKIKAQIDEVLEFANISYERSGNFYDVIIKGSKEYDEGKVINLQLKSISREIENIAERNAEKKPFSKNENVLKLLFLNESKTVFKEQLKDKNPYYYVPLLSVVEELHEKKILSIKKL